METVVVVAAVVIYVVVRAPRWLVVVSVGDRHVVRWGCVCEVLGRDVRAAWCGPSGCVHGAMSCLSTERCCCGLVLCWV